MNLVVWLLPVLTILFIGEFSEEKLKSDAAKIWSFFHIREVYQRKVEDVNTDPSKYIMYDSSYSRILSIMGVKFLFLLVLKG